MFSTLLHNTVTKVCANPRPRFIILFLLVRGQGLGTRLVEPAIPNLNVSRHNHAMERIFRSTLHTEWLPGVHFSTTCAIHIEDCEGWLLSGCHSSVVEHCQLMPGDLGSIHGDCWLFTFLFISSVHVTRFVNMQCSALTVKVSNESRQQQLTFHQ